MRYSVLNASIVGRVGSALANDRVQTTAAGHIVLKLKTPWRDGTTHLLVPPPNAKLRALVVCGEAAVGLALQAVITAVLDLLGTRRGKAYLSWLLPRTLAARSG